MIDAEATDNFAALWKEFQSRTPKAEGMNVLQYKVSYDYRELDIDDRNLVDELASIQKSVDEIVTKINTMSNVPLATYYENLEKWETGGGCQAYVEHRNHVHVMITEEGGCSLPSISDKHVSVGLYIDVSEPDENIDIGLGENCILSMGQVSVINLEAFVDLLLIGSASIWESSKVNHNA